MKKMNEKYVQYSREREILQIMSFLNENNIINVTLLVHLH